MADSVGVALQVVLDTLSPGERLAFVLHDIFDLPFEEIGRVMGRTTQATRQLASRARRRVRGGRRSPRLNGVVITSHGRAVAVMGFTISDDKIIEIDSIGDPERVRRLTAAVMG
jgi:hypothetical protein